MIRRHRVLLPVAALLLCGGCATISPSQAGQTVGTLAGAAIAPGIGAPIGALVGMLAGMAVQGQVDKVVEKRERVELQQELASGERAASAPPSHASQGQPTRVWVDETEQNGRLVAAHFDVRYL